VGVDLEEGCDIVAEALGLQGRTDPFGEHQAE
jgi:hypothetical protein